MYTLDNIHSFLLNQQLISSEDLLEGDYEVTSLNRRNRNLRINTTANKNYLIKQVYDKHSENAKTLLTELKFYEHAKENTSISSNYFPKVHFADYEQLILVLEYYDNSKPLWKYYKDCGIANMPLHVVEEWGSLLARIHLDLDNRYKNVCFLSEELPFAFNIHKPHSRILANVRKGGLDFLRKLQNNKRLLAVYDEIRDNWHPNSVIHGDIKLDNVIVINSDRSNQEIELKLVDWEMVQKGDRAWDIAGGLQDFIFYWLIMMPEAETAKKMIHQSPFQFSALQPAINTYWKSYNSVMNSELDDSFLNRSIQLSGFRCLQTSYEIASKFDYIPPIAEILFNLGSEIVLQPEFACRKMFSIS